MKKKNTKLLLLGFASISMVLTGCQSHQEASSSSSESSFSSETSESVVEPDDDPVITYNKIKLSSPAKGEEIEITPKPLLDYINAATVEEQAKALLEASKAENKNLTCTSVKLSWVKDGSANYTVMLADNEAFENPITTKVSSLSNTCEIYNLIPSTTYYWKVTGTRSHDTSEVSTFKTLGSSVRFIRASGTCNLRDLGGWKSGEKALAYGKLYRGACLNTSSGLSGLDDYGKKVFNEELGIQTEIDLRLSGKDDNNQLECCFDSSKRYIQAQMGQYNRVLDPDSFAKSNGAEDYPSLLSSNYNLAASDDGITQRSLRTIFETLSKPESYPVYFHCNAGADRTGTLAFLIEGLLGVSYEDTIRDFELTSFSQFGNRFRSNLDETSLTFDDSGVYPAEGNYVGFGKFHDDLMSYYGDGKNDLSYAIENYLVSYIGVLPSQIDKVKEILLNETSSSIRLPTKQEFLLTSSSASLDLSEAKLDADSISSISLAGVELGTNPDTIDLSSLQAKGIAGEREVVVKAKKDGKDVEVFAPVTVITKLITNVTEFQALDTYRTGRVINYGYYRLSNDIGSAPSPVNKGGYVQEQFDATGAGGFRGTIDGNGKTVYIRANYGGLFSVLGGGSRIQNVNFAIPTFGSYDNSCQAVFGIAICGSEMENVSFNVLKNGWGSNYSKAIFGSNQGFISSSIAHGNLFKNVNITSVAPLVSLFGGPSYEGMGGCEFDSVILDCPKLAYLGVKRSISGGSINLANCVLPIEAKGITGSYATENSKATTLSSKEEYASLDLDARYSGMNLLEATFDGNVIPGAVLEENRLVFSLQSAMGDSRTSGTVIAKMEKNGLICSYSLPISFAK